MASERGASAGSLRHYLASDTAKIPKILNYLLIFANIILFRNQDCDKPQIEIPYLIGNSKICLLEGLTIQPLSMTTPRILVTGAAGFIGSHTVDQLLRLGCSVLGVDDLSTGQLANLREARTCRGFQFVRADLTAPETLDQLCDFYRPDSLVHLAGLVSIGRAKHESDLDHRLNLQATHLVAEAARKQGIRRLVFASSAAVYGNASPVPLSEASPTQPISLAGEVKRASEEALRGHAASFGLEAICLRYFNVFGPRQDPDSLDSGVISIFARRFAEGLPVTIFGNGIQTRDFISVYDVARANAIAATRPGLSSTTCNVCTGQPERLLSILNTFRSFYPKAPLPRFEPPRAGELLHSCGDPRQAASDLGFVSETDLTAGLRSLIGRRTSQPVASLSIPA